MPQCRRVPGHRDVTNEERDPHPFPLDVDIVCFDLNSICDRIGARLDEDLPSRRRQRIEGRLQRREISFGGVRADYESGLVSVKYWLTGRGWRWGGHEVPPLSECDRGIVGGGITISFCFLCVNSIPSTTMTAVTNKIWLSLPYN